MYLLIYLPWEKRVTAIGFTDIYFLGDVISSQEEQLFFVSLFFLPSSLSLARSLLLAILRSYESIHICIGVLYTLESPKLARKSFISLGPSYTIRYSYASHSLFSDSPCSTQRGEIKREGRRNRESNTVGIVTEHTMGKCRRTKASKRRKMVKKR